MEKIRLKNLKALPKTNYTIETARMKGRICKATDPFDHYVSHLLYSVENIKHINESHAVEILLYDVHQERNYYLQGCKVSCVTAN